MGTIHFLAALMLLAGQEVGSEVRRESPPEPETPAVAPSREGEPGEQIDELETPKEVITETGFWAENRARVDRAVNLYFANPIRPRTIFFTLDHRTNESLVDSGFSDYLGFDAGGLKIGLGLRYGILENLDAGFFRLNGTAEIFDTYEFDARYRILQQATAAVDLAIRAGLTWFTQPERDDAVGFLAQVLVDRVFADRLLVGVGLLFHSDSSNDVKSMQADDASLGIQAMLELRILPFLSWDVELAFSVAGYGADYPMVATSLKCLTHRHTFSLVFTNNQYLGADGVVANTWRGLKDIIVGFQITREFNL